MSKAPALFFVLLLSVCAVAFADGTPLFVQPPTVGSIAAYPVKGDFNGDGKADVASAEPSAGKVLLHIGKGDGTFDAATSQSTAFYGGAPAAGDLNGDGRTDVAVVSAMTNVNVFLGNADGTFSAAKSWSSFNEIGSIAIADATGDGRADVIVHPSSGTAAMVVLAGDASGNKTQETTTPGSAYAESIVAADFNGDGRADVGYSSNGKIYIRLNSGSGSYGGETEVGNGSVGLAAADFDGDGKIDLAATSGVTFRGNGNGTFAAPVARFAAALRVYAADLSKDGRADIFAVYNASTAILTGRADGGFDDVGRFTALPTPAFGDFNGDGNVDVLSGSSFVAGNGDGTLRADRVYAGSSVTEVLALDDSTNDTKRDAILLAQPAGGNVQLLVAPGTGNGLLGTPITTSTTIPFANSVTAADFTGDGRVDVAISNEAAHTVHLFVANGNGTFSAASPFTPTGYGTLAHADFTGDGIQDLLLAGYYYPGSSSGTLGSGTFVGTNGIAADANGDGHAELIDDTQAVAAADFDDDGLVDLLVTSANLVAVRRGHGNGTFDAPVWLAAPISGYATVADFDGDGHLDVRFPGIVLIGDGDGSFARAEVAPQGVGAAGDLNGDGAADLALLDIYGNASVQVALAQPDATPATVAPSLALSIPPSLVYGAPDYTFTADMTGTAIAPVGAVTFKLDSIVRGFALLSAGSGSIVQRELPGGAHTFTAEYGGSSTHAAKTVSSSISVAKATTTITATASSQIEPSTSCAVYVGFSSTAYSYLPLGGDVTFRDNGAVVKVVSVTSKNSFWADLGQLTAGTHTIQVTYGGDSNNSSATTSVVVNVEVPFGSSIAATATAGTTTINVQWPPVGGATSYDVYRSSGGNAYAKIVTVSTLSYSDTAVSAGTAYLYRVLARIDSNGSTSPLGTPDLAMIVSFTDANLSGARVKAAHFNELRTAVNAVRTAASLAPFSFTTPISGVVRASQLTQLRSALAEARTKLGLSSLAVTDATPTLIRAVHLTELRTAVQ